MDSISWKYYKREGSDYFGEIEGDWSRIGELDKASQDIVRIFNDNVQVIGSEVQKKALEEGKRSLSSNQVLSQIKDSLKTAGFVVEEGKKRISCQVKAKTFNLDGLKDNQYALEVEASRATLGNQILKDILEIFLIDGIQFACIAVRKEYYFKKDGKIDKSHDFDNTVIFLDPVMESSWVPRKIEGLLIIGY